MSLHSNKYIEADKILNDFLNNKVANYSKYRNYDYGIKNPKKVSSGLSHYISRGIVKEEFILHNIKKKNINPEKFIQEILWRTYWKGWLESHTSVWESYKTDLTKELTDITKSDKFALYKKAITGETSLKPFNYWLEQLKNSGYLHNHARMWFASIWVHYFALPWELGAKLFYDNLLDADISSNTLSWRWVTGIQTKGKKYIARKDNIDKYTFSRFKDYRLPNYSDITLKDEYHVLNNIEYDHNNLIKENSKNAFLVVENNLSFNLIKNNKKYISVVVLLKINPKLVNKNAIVKDFQKECNNDLMHLCNKNNILFKEFDLSSSFSSFLDFVHSLNIENIYSEYITVGFEKDLITKLKILLKRNNIEYFEILDSFYKKAWLYSDKGFFNFKKNFDKILSNTYK